MLDVFLTNSLLKAVSYGTRIIFVGDKDQLPSVGAGNVLSDIISSNMFKVVELSQIFRQSEDSMIIVNAHKINNSEMIDLKTKSSDFFYSSVFEPERVANEVVTLMSERMPNYFKDITSDDIQVIAPMKSGMAGVDNLNILIQDKLNPSSHRKNEFTLHKRIFREGDRVMQIVNNYDREYCFDKDSVWGGSCFRDNNEGYICR
jgi:exodeoxyribonuclease V alpha subunit